MISAFSSAENTPSRTWISIEGTTAFPVFPGKDTVGHPACRWSALDRRIAPWHRSTRAQITRPRPSGIAQPGLLSWGDEWDVLDHGVLSNCRLRVCKTTTPLYRKAPDEPNPRYKPTSAKLEKDRHLTNTPIPILVGHAWALLCLGSSTTAPLVGLREDLDPCPNDGNSAEFAGLVSTSVNLA